MDLKKMKKTLEKQGLEAEKVEEILKEYQKEEEKEFENTMTVHDAAVYLNANLKDNWNEAKVRRFINEFKEIIPAANPGKAKRLGYRIEKAELDRFIERHKMTKEDWKNYAIQLEKEIESLKKQLEQYEPKKEEKVDEIPQGQITIEELEEEQEESENTQEAVQEEKKEPNTNTLVQEEKHGTESNSKPKDKRKTGVLEKNQEDGRYYVKGTDFRYTSGNAIEFYGKNRKYIASSVEHGGESNDYYIVALGKDVPIEGIKVRY